MRKMLMLLTNASLALFVMGCSGNVDPAPVTNGNGNAKPELGEAGSAVELMSDTEEPAGEKGQDVTPAANTDGEPAADPETKVDDQPFAASETKSDSTPAKGQVTEKTADDSIVDDTTDDIDEEDQR